MTDINLTKDNAAQEAKKRLKPRKEVGKKGGEEGEGLGTWILSYADMVTLLLCFFVIIAMMSTPNQQKLETVSASMAGELGKEGKKPMQEVAKEVQKMITDEHLENELKVSVGAEGVKITFLGQQLFESGSAQIHPTALPKIKKIAELLKADASSFYVIAEGHTDDVPIVSDTFPSNWELSAGRASTVIRNMINFGIPSNRCKSIGYADTLPEVPNRDAAGNPIPENQAKNRRVVIKLSKNLKE